jgi:hypothetical protein
MTYGKNCLSRQKRATENATAIDTSRGSLRFAV